MLNKVLKVWLVGMVFLGLGVTAPAKADASLEAEQMLKFFSASCPSQGQWTQTALNYANNLVETIKTLQNDPDCKSFSGSLAQLQSLTTVFRQISQDPDQKALMALKKQQEEVLLLLGASTNATQSSQLSAELQALNLQIAEAQSNAFSNSEYRNTQAQGMALTQLVSGTNILLKQAAQNATCIQKTPGILPAIAGLTGSVQSALMTSGYSMIVGAGADLINGVVEGIRKTRIGRKINKMSSAITASAYQCVLESLSNQWCTSQGALQVIRLKGKSIVHTSGQSSLEQGIELLNEDYEVFLEWLDTLRAGTDPANEATAARQAEVLDRDKQVRVARLNGLGVIAEDSPIFQSTQGDELRWRVEQKVIQNIVEYFINSGGPGKSSPLSDVFGTNPRELSPWFLIGVSDASIPRDPNTGGRRSLSSFAWKDIPMLVGDVNFKPDLGFVQKNMLAWVGLAKDRVNTELSLILNLDPLKLMVDAATPTLNGESPYDSLKKLIEFMKSQTPRTTRYGSFKGIYADTVNRLEVIQSSIEKVLQGSPDTTDSVMAAETITGIYKVAVLDNGVGFLGDRLKWAIRLSLNALVTSGTSGISNAEAAALLASNDIVRELQRFSPDADLNSMARDIQNSQVVLESTLQSFADQFGSGMALALYDYQYRAGNQSQDPSGTSSLAMSELCLKLLAVPVWPSAISKDLCVGKSLSSVFQDGPTSVVINSDVIQSNFQKRVCSFRDYERKNRLYQYYKERSRGLISQ